MRARGAGLIDAAVVAPILAGHLAVFLLPGSEATLTAYMLGYAASLAAVSARREYRHLLIIPAAGFVIGLIAEIVGVNTGVPFGRYEYVSLRAPRVLGVPITVPIMWGLYAYLTYLISASIIRKGGVARAVHASLLMVTLDLAMDPFMANKVHAWVWLSGWGPEWYGIPASNFIGWLIVSLTILLTHELTTKNTQTPNTYPLTIPYTCLTLFFASLTNPQLVATTATLTTTLIAAPTIITHTKQH